ncbi:MAG TPA: amidohydrolase [Vicinamibacterales bacterium]|nr:amidohydrolase [Acidobacteriota bacterium]HJO16916.1 amidohydrolase [Vicinamibacterales bacterium]
MRTRSTLVGVYLSMTVVLSLGCGPGLEPADLVLHNGKIVTVDDANPEAQALAVRGNEIVAVGTNDEVDAYRSEMTTVIDLDGRLAIPGFIEGHGHFLGVGNAQMQLRLMDTQNWEEVVSMVAAAVEQVEPGQLIRGRGWHQEKWDPLPEPNIEGFPFHDRLSEVSPDNPVLLTHASGHATFANARAMEMSGITRNTPNPDGGEILRDSRNNPIGVFRETASRLLSAASADATPPDPRRQVELAVAEALSKGVTSFQDAGSSFETVDLLKSMVDDGSLGIRLWVMLRESNEALAARGADYRMVGYGDNHLTVRAIKRSIDGALGSRGAWLLEPYSDSPESTGLNTTTPESISNTAAWAIANDFQLCVHAIGDRANRETLDIFQRVFEANPDKSDLRWRDEHTQHLHPDDIPRFAELGVIASMQGVHCTSDAPYVVARLGEQRAEQGAYVWKTLLETGAVVSNGTDAPVEDVSPLASYYATVSRKLADGSVFYPDQRLSRLEALQTYTINAAFAAFEEDIKGSLSVGKLADITVLSKDVMTISEDEIPSTEVLYTIVGGKVMYSQSN